MNWTIDSTYNSGFSLHQFWPFDECYFDFPSGSDHVNFIERPQGAVKIGQTVTLKFRVRRMSGNPVFQSLDNSPAPPSLLPNFRPMLFTGDWFNPDGRWWPTGMNCEFLKSTLDYGLRAVFNVKIDPKQWSNVNGKMGAQHLPAFQSAMQNIQTLVISFGGGDSFDHGVTTTGGIARFTLFSSSIK